MRATRWSSLAFALALSQAVMAHADASLPSGGKGKTGESGRIKERARAPWTARCATSLSRAADDAIVANDAAGGSTLRKDLTVGGGSVVRLSLMLRVSSRDSVGAEVSIVPRVVAGDVVGAWSRQQFDRLMPTPRVVLARHVRWFDASITLTSERLPLEPYESRLRAAADECLR